MLLAQSLLIIVRIFGIFQDFIRVVHLASLKYNEMVFIEWIMQSQMSKIFDFKNGLIK